MDKKFKRGISLVEVVLAIVIITMVSIFATTLVVSSVQNESKNVRDNEIVTIAENAIECYRFCSAGGESYTEVLSEIYPDIVTVNEVIESITVTKHTIYRNNYCVEIYINNNKLIINAWDNIDKTGDRIYNLEY